MKIAAVTTVRNESDIVESFVRHNAAFIDRLYILDHRSTDSTPAILRRLIEEGLPLTASREDDGIFRQGPTMTRLIKRAMEDDGWNFILPLDCDEFLRIESRSSLERALAELDGASVGSCDVVNYIPYADDDSSECDVLRRIVHRVRTIPELSCKIRKVIIPAAVVARAGFSLHEGHHGVQIDGKRAREQRVGELELAHFPVRSIEQFAHRAIVCSLAWYSRSDYNPHWGWHYRKFCDQIKRKPALSADDLTEAALLYVDIYLETGSVRHQKIRVRDPVAPRYERLRFADLVEVNVLPPVIDMAEFLMGELRELQLAAGGAADPSDISRPHTALAQQIAENKRLRARLDDIVGSTSWRVTAPLRIAKQYIAELTRIGTKR